MRSHAKAPSAITFGRKGLAVLALIALALTALFALASASPAFAGKVVDRVHAGTIPSGVAGGQLNEPRGVAANATGAGAADPGDVYVVDGANNRVQQFSAEGDFIRAFGRDVIAPSVNEVQQLIVTASAGQFRLEFNGQSTGNLAFDAIYPEVETALRGLSTINGANVSLSGPSPSNPNVPYVITFTGALASANQPEIKVLPGTNPLIGNATTTTIADGAAPGATADTGTGFEKCTNASHCKVGITSPAEGGTFDNPQGIAVNQSNGDVYVTDSSGNRVQQFSAEGDFIRVWGADVISAGMPNDNGTAFEVCDTAAGNAPSDCKAGISSAQGGGFGSSLGHLAIAPAGAPNAGHLYVADRGNRRVQQFGADGTWVRAFGWDVIQPGGTGEVGNGTFNEKQSVQPKDFFGGTITGGSFTLSFGAGGPGVGTTADIAWNATAAQVDSALEAISNVGAGNVAVTGGPGPDSPWIVEFIGALAGTDVVQMTGDANKLISEGGFFPFPAVSISTTESGGLLPGFEICTVSVQCKGGADSSPQGEAGSFSSGSPVHLTVGADGTLYASDSAANNRIARFATSETTAAALLMPAIDVSALTSTASTTTTGLALTASGNLLVARNASIGVLELSSPAGSPAEASRHYQGANLNPSAIALDSASGDLYLTTNANGHRVFAADDNGAPAPIVTVSPPTELTEHTATLRGEVNPDSLGIPLSYRFQVSRNGATWDDVHANVNLGVGTSPIPVQAEVSGLEGATFYRARIVTTKPFGNSDVVSPEVVFLTDSVAPEAKTHNPIHIEDTTATLRGQLNPNNLATTYHFEYGETTAYGSKAPIPDASLSGGTDKQIYQEIASLKAETTYHVRLVATNPEGTTKGTDVEFRTYPSTPAAPARAYEMMTPPFKSLPQFGGPAEMFNDPSPGVPSLDGEKVVWANGHFPLSDEVDAPMSGDIRLMRRTPSGWTFETRNTLPLKAICRKCGPDESVAPTLRRIAGGASSGDMETIAYGLSAGTEAELLPSEGPHPNLFYTRRDGTGVEGWTPWLTNPFQQIPSLGPNYISTNFSDPARINDDGTAMVRWFLYRGLAEDPTTPLDDDPSDSQQLANPASTDVNFNIPGGRTIYLQHSDDPLQMPSSPKVLVNECSGSDSGDATVLPARIGSGSSTDTIGTQDCWSSAGAPEATGTATAIAGTNTITSLSTSSGTFEVGQIVKGPGIPPNTQITAKGAGTLTLSAANTSAPKASGEGQVENGSNVITSVSTSKGTFAVGQKVRVAPLGFFIPPPPFDATITAVGSGTLTIDVTVSGLFPNPDTATLSVNELPNTPLEADSVHVTSMRGAAVGGGGGSAQFGLRNTFSQTAMSEDGSRIFFTSPDNLFEVSLPETGCTDATGPVSHCVPQLFVHQIGSDGERTVRWISRAQGVGAQRVAELGRGALFEGASRSGDSVYFKTNSPLLPNDPNGGNSITTGAASDKSFDLYRYELPGGLDEDPANGTLTRVSGGPTGNADPSTNNSTEETLLTVGSGGAMRYLSDDGRLAYFVTTSPLAGADTVPPQGGSTAPGGTVGNGTRTSGTRNLYLFDDTGDSPEWRFVARLPFAAVFRSEGGAVSSGAAALDACGSHDLPTADLGSFSTLGNGAGATTGMRMEPRQGNCFRGTPDGKHVLFSTTGQVTADDTDEASDIYLYDYERDELTRITAPPPGAEPYRCNHEPTQAPFVGGVCNGDIGIDLGGAGPILSTAGLAPAASLSSARGWAGGRYYNLAEDENGVVSAFFNSRVNLVPEDKDTLGRSDVYQWREGELTMMTPEIPDSAYWYSGSSLDGEDLFLSTPARLDPREIDEVDIDLYDLRVGGGIPYTPPPTPCDVLAHQCRSTAAPNPEPRNAASASFSGGGNLAPKAKKGKKQSRCGKGKVRSKKGRCVAKKSRKRTNKNGRAGR